MYYVQFYQRAAYPVGTTNIIEASGDRSVVILDGRLRPQSMGRIAAAECAKRGYLAWRIFRGESFTRSAPVSQIWYAPEAAPDTPTMQDPAWLSAHSM